MTSGVAGSLARVLTPLEVLMLTVSALSPVLSVFLGGNAVLHLAGTGAALGFIAGGVLSALFALLFAELAAAYPGAGGLYPALNAVLGPRWTFGYVALRLVLIFPIAAFFALGLGSYAGALLPGVPPLAISAAAMVLAAVIACLNIKRGAHVIALFLAVEMAALGVLAWTGASNVVRSPVEVVLHPSHLNQGTMQPVSLATMALAVVSGMSMAAGAGWAMYFAEEMDQAHRRIGRVVAWAGLIAAVTIAVPVVLVVLAIGDLPQVLAADAPMAEFLRITAGPTVSTLVTMGVVAAIFNALIAAIMGLSRQLFAIGRDGVLPGGVDRVLAIVHPRLRSPVGATTVLAALGAACLLLGEKRLLLIVSGNFAEYFLIGAAVIVGRARGLLGHNFKVPLHPLVPLIAIGAGAGVILANWGDAGTARKSMALLLGIFAAAFIWHEARIRQGRPPIGLKGSDIDE